MEDLFEESKATNQAKIEKIKKAARRKAREIKKL